MRQIQFVHGNYYHIYNRGNNRQEIFLEDENYRFFLTRAHHYFDPYGIDIVAYCLMPNHFHLVLYLTREIDFSKVMRRLSVSYAKSFNRWYRRTGHLFQGNYQVRLVEENNHLTHLCRYVHLNPVYANLVQFPEEWRYSDYSEWVFSNDDMQPNIKSRKMFFGNAAAYKKFVSDFADEKNKQKEMERLLFGW